MIKLTPEHINVACGRACGSTRCKLENGGLEIAE
nr:MAG TPA: hypothetical protein [Caudoviricetes sp.]